MRVPFRARRRVPSGKFAVVPRGVLQILRDGSARDRDPVQVGEDIANLVVRGAPVQVVRGRVAPRCVIIERGVVTTPRHRARHRVEVVVHRGPWHVRVVRAVEERGSTARRASVEERGADGSLEAPDDVLDLLVDGRHGGV